MIWLRWPLSGLRWAMLLVPAVVAILSAVADQGLSGEGRPSWFPWALGINDPIIRASLRHSLIAAALIALGARYFGMALAQATGRWRFWGRRPLFLLALLPIVLPPALGAIGWIWLFQTDGPILDLASRLAVRGLDSERLREALTAWSGWAGLVWLGIAMGAPIVALSVRQVLDRIEPSWEESAIAAGASRRQAWRQLARPLARRQATRAAIVLFAISWAEPGGPLILGLRETVGYQIMEAASASESGSASRLGVLASSWGLAVAAIALAARGRGRGGLADLPRPTNEGGSARRAGPLRASAFGLGLIVWAALAALPMAGLIGAAFDVQWRGGPRWSGSAFLTLPEDDAMVGALLRTIGVAALVLAASWVFAMASASASAPASGASRFQRGLELLSPLTLGAGLVLLPHWLRATDAPGAGVWRWLDGDTTPILVCAWAATLFVWPNWRDIAAALRDRERPELREAALMAGASPADARRMGRVGRRIDPWLPAIGLTLALTIANDGPQLVIGQTAGSRLLAPEIIHRASLGLNDSVSTTAAAAACLIAALNLMVFPLAFASRIAPTPALTLRDSDPPR